MNTLSLPLPNQLLLVIAPQAAKPQMLDLAAHLAIGGPLRVLDGGNQFNVYPVARTIRRLSHNLTATLQSITLARAFTCYQMVVMLNDAPILTTPTLVFDLLSTFYDENVTMQESQRLLLSCFIHLRRLSQQAPVVISARPPAPVCQERLPLLEQLRRITNLTWEAQEPTNLQPEITNGTNLTFNYPGLS